MKKEELNKLTKEIEDISSNFEDKPFSDNVRLLKEDFDHNLINNPNYYSDVMANLKEVYREARHLFIISVLKLVCKEESKVYYFDKPFETTIKYIAAMKKDETFFILDEDGDFRDVFTSERFSTFIDDLYWELYQE